jgi:hypothetical protein
VPVDTPLGLYHVELDCAIPSVPTWYACPETTGVEERRPKKRRIGLSMDAGWRKRSSGSVKMNKGHYDCKSKFRMLCSS